MANIELTEEEKMISSLPRTDEMKDFFNFHPTSTPRGLQFYDKFVLNARQQNELNIFKANIARENHKYMAAHPEIRAMIALFLRRLLKHSLYRVDVKTAAAKFFSRTKSDIETEIEQYLTQRNEKVTKDYDKHVEISSQTIEMPSQVTIKDYTFSTFTEQYVSSSDSIEEEADEKDWKVSGLLDYLIGKADGSEEQTIIIGEEQDKLPVIPHSDDIITVYSGITKTSSYIDHTIPSVPDVTSITTDVTKTETPLSDVMHEQREFLMPYPEATYYSSKDAVVTSSKTSFKTPSTIEDSKTIADAEVLKTSSEMGYPLSDSSRRTIIAVDIIQPSSDHLITDTSVRVINSQSKGSIQSTSRSSDRVIHDSSVSSTGKKVVVLECENILTEDVRSKVELEIIKTELEAVQKSEDRVDKVLWEN